MRLRDGVRSDIEVRLGEKITVQILRPNGLQDLVNYSLAGTDSPGTKGIAEDCIFDVTETSALVITCTPLPGQSGASFAVRVTGDPGTQVSEKDFAQSGTAAFQAITYNFFVQ